MNTKKNITVTFITVAIVLIIVTSFVGCAGSATKVIVAPGYKKRFAIDATLAVAILDNAPQTVYFGALKMSIGSPLNDKTETETLVLRYFRELLVKHLLSEIDVKEAFVAEADRNYLVTKDGVSTADEDVVVEIPDIGTKIKFGGREASLVLLLDKIRIGTETDPYYPERAKQGVYAGAPRKLVFLTNFVLWDNREYKPICYGRVKTFTPITQAEATSDDWDEITRDFVRMAFERTGFRKRDDRGKM